MLLPSEIQKALRINALLDVYGAMLTERQREAMELYYRDDLSLGEIAAETGISRQAVHDLIQRGGQTLDDLEARLGVCRLGRRRREQLQQALEALERGKNGQAKKILLKVIEEEPY